MSDIVDRLRKSAACGDFPFYHDEAGHIIPHSDNMEEAADLILALRQQLDEARERNLIANERADNAVADLEKAREAHEALKALTIKRSDLLREAESKALLLEGELLDAQSALEPFASWGRNNVELVLGSVDADGQVTPGYWQWRDAQMRERVVDWFGPSDFGAAITTCIEDIEGA